MNQKLKQVHVKRLLAYSMILVLVSMGFYQIGRSTVGPGEQSEQWYTPEQEATYIVGPFNSTFFFAKNHTGYGLSAYEGYELIETDDDDLLQYCVNQTTTSGGLVYVKEGTYVAAVTLKNNVRLVLANGASAITVSINAGATAVLEDWNAVRLRSWKAGTLTWDSNLDAGSLTTLSAVLSGALNVTTIYVSTVDALVASTGTKILKLIVENGSSFPTTNLVDSRMFYRWDEGYLYVYNNSLWKQVGTTLYSNLTGTPDLTTLVYVNGTNALTGSWNVGGSYGIYGATWVNATNLSTNYLFLGSLTSDPVSPVAGQLWYRSDIDTLRYYNGTGVVDIPGIGGGGASYVLPYSYTVYKTGSTYYAEKYDGTILTSSTNASQVINFAIGNLTSGRTYQETVILRGSFSIATKIQVPNYTHIILDGKITRTADVPIFALDTAHGLATTCTLTVTIFGGILDGGGTSYTEDMIQMYNCKEVIIEQVNFRNFCGNGIYLNGESSASYKSFWNRFIHLQFGFFTSSGIAANSAFFYFDRYAIDNEITECFGDASSVTSGNRPDGIYYPGLSGGGCIWVRGCHFASVESFLELGSASITAEVNLIDCYADRCKGHAVNLGDRTQHVYITNMKFFDTAASFSDIYANAANYVENVHVRNCYSFSVAKDYFANFASTVYRNIVFKDNYITCGALGYWGGWLDTTTGANRTGNIYYVGTGTAWTLDDDSGTGTFTSAATSYTFDHGLYTTPTDVNINWLETIGGRQWYYTATATQITVYLTNGVIPFLSGTIANAKTDGTDEFWAFSGMSSLATAAAGADRGELMPLAGTLQNCNVSLAAAPGAGMFRIFTLYKNGAATTITVNITDTNTFAVDAVHTVTTAPGDLLCWMSDGGTGTPAATTVRAGIEFYPSAAAAEAYSFSWTARV